MLGRGVNPQIDLLAALELDLSRADLALANLESPLAPVLTGADSPYNLCTLSSNAQMLDDWGFDLLSIANNHSLDCGPGGLGETLSALQSVGITPIDPGMVPVFMKVNGLQLAFLSFDDISSTIDTITAVKSIQSAKQAGAMVVVSIHWGAEYQGGASDRQKFLAAQFAEGRGKLDLGTPSTRPPACRVDRNLPRQNTGPFTAWEMHYLTRMGWKIPANRPWCWSP